MHCPTSIPTCDASGTQWRRFSSAVLRATPLAPAAALVIGANTGNINTDPSFRWLVAPALREVVKVFVEPLPRMHSLLRANLVNVTHATAVQAAITPESQNVQMFCVVPDIQADGSVAAPAWWSQVCSLDRERLFSEYDMLRGLADGLAGASVRTAERTAAIARRVHSTSVPGLSVDDLLRKHVPSGVRVEYVQIDAEGADDRIVASLPFSPVSRGGDKQVAGFLPATVVFEHVLLSEGRRRRAMDRLLAHGYSMCCDFQNVVAVQNVTYAALRERVHARGRSRPRSTRRF